MVLPPKFWSDGIQTVKMKIYDFAENILHLEPGHKNQVNDYNKS